MLLLDEPVAGVPEGERQEILDIVNALPAEVSVLLIEHDMDLVFNFARRVTVLVNGAIFAEGDAATVAADPRVMAVYLGEGGPWLSCCASRACAPATARPSSSRASASRSTQGQSLALLGRNGTGKTTLLNTLVGVTQRFFGPHRPRRPGPHRACRRTRASPPASAGCRRSETSSSR